MRKLTPELLDSLAHDDPGAVRSRRDLARINRFMGNDSWIIRCVGSTPSHITEIGAGEGILLNQLSSLHPEVKMDAYDLAPRPEHLSNKVHWHQGDLLNQPPPKTGGVLIANLFLHHFTDEQLTAFAPWLEGFDTLIINEPLRTRMSLFFGRAAYPFINSITRHDMRVSIEAGFVESELPRLLDLEGLGFSCEETEEWRGAVRILAKI